MKLLKEINDRLRLERPVAEEKIVPAMLHQAMPRKVENENILRRDIRKEQADSVKERCLRHKARALAPRPIHPDPVRRYAKAEDQGLRHGLKIARRGQVRRTIEAIVCRDAGQDRLYVWI